MLDLLTAAFLQDANPIDAGTIIYALAGVIATLAGAILWLFKWQREMSQKMAETLALTAKSLDDNSAWMKTIDQNMAARRDLLDTRLESIKEQLPK